MVEKVIATEAALALVAELQAPYAKDLMFHQSGGDCDNSAANCYLPGEITMGAGDVYLATLAAARSPSAKPFTHARGRSHPSN